jgi:hypothetical protein
MTLRRCYLLPFALPSGIRLGCGGDDPKIPAVADSLQLPASPETKSALGVAGWGRRTTHIHVMACRP